MLPLANRTGDENGSHPAAWCHHIANSWTIRIALSETEYLDLSREFATGAPPVIAPFAGMTAKVLQAKIAGIPYEPTVPFPARSSSVLSLTPVS
jgi:hypothetical protein